MKKFIISFDYKGFSFSAKVMVKRNDGNVLITTNVINTELTYLFEHGRLIFVESGNGFQLLLIQRDKSFETLNWNISLEYIDKSKIVDEEVFSLS